MEALPPCCCTPPHPTPRAPCPPSSVPSPMTSYFAHGGLQEGTAPTALEAEAAEPPAPAQPSKSPAKAPASAAEQIRDWLQNLDYCRPARHLSDCAGLGQVAARVERDRPGALTSADKAKELQAILRELSKEKDMSWLFRCRWCVSEALSIVHPVSNGQGGP